MDNTQLGVLTLIKSAITGTAEKLPESFDLGQAENIIQNHSVQSLAFAGALNCGINKQHPAMQALFKQYCAALLRSEKQMFEIEKIYAAFENNVIDYMPLKGCRMKALYPKPELRTMGDADILIRTEQYKAIESILTELGFTFKNKLDHEIVWFSSALMLELHTQIMSVRHLDFRNYFKDGWWLAKKATGRYHQMSAEDEFIYLFTHFTKHFRGGGIGCRHVTDIWVYLRSNPDLDQNYITEHLSKLNILEFYNNILGLIGVWFEGEKSSDKLELISDFIFSSGNWGSSETHVLSDTAGNTVKGRFGLKGRGLYIVSTLFPRLEVVKAHYPILEKRPWLLPVVWFIRFFQKVLCKPDVLQQQKRNIKAASQGNVEQYYKMLKAVGLDFNF